MTRVHVSIDGQTSNMTMQQFLADNEAAENICKRVQELKPGEIYKPFEDMSIEVVESAKPKGGPRVAKFVVPWHFDRTQAAIVKINRSTMMVEVRPYRRRKSHFIALADLAQITVERSFAAEKSRKKAEKKKARMARRNA